MRPPIHFVTPDPKLKQRALMRKLEASSPQFSISNIRKQLGEIRRISMVNYWKHVETLRKTFEEMGVEFAYARDASEAAGFIQKISSSSNTQIAALNKSSVLKELKPELLAQGFTVRDTYAEQFINRLNEPADLHALMDISEDIVWDSFAVSPYHSGESDEPAKDMIGILGVSVISSQDAATFFVQHFTNITQTLQDAAATVLVISPDKIVGTMEDAVFQAHCTAFFGWRPALSDLVLRIDRGEQIMPIPVRDADTCERKLYAVILDNGRSGLLNSDYDELFNCIGCRRCILPCPTYNYFNGETLRNPKEYLHHHLLGLNKTVELCVNCGLCSTECPTLDIHNLLTRAKIDYAEKHGQEFTNRFLMRYELSRIACEIAPLANWLTNTSFVKLLNDKLLGIDKRRTLPKFGGETFRNWFKSTSRNPRGNGKIAYFHGCFFNFSEPNVGKSFVNVFEEAGFEVLVPSQKCCGMPMITYGNLPLVKKRAEANVAKLSELVREKIDIVSACTSCVYMLTQYGSILNTEDAMLVSNNTYDATEYLMRLRRQGQLNLEFNNPSMVKVAYHAPCHLKARTTDTPSVDILGGLPGLSVVSMDKGCCGICGTFGFKKKNYMKSLEIGHKLFQEVNNGSYDAVATDCPTCRVQLQHQTSKRVLHPIQIIEASLASS